MPTSRHRAGGAQNPPAYLALLLFVFLDRQLSMEEEGGPTTLAAVAKEVEVEVLVASPEINNSRNKNKIW